MLGVRRGDDLLGVMRLAFVGGVALAFTLMVSPKPSEAQSTGGGRGHNHSGGMGGGGGRHAATRPATASTTSPARTPSGGPMASAEEGDAVDPPLAKPLRFSRFVGQKRHGKIGPNTPIATYPGFKMLPDGSSRVFVEVSRQVDIVETKSSSRVSYRLKGVFAPSKTNRLPLLTDFFRSPVGRVQLVDDGDDLELVIDLREASDVQHRLVQSEGGVVLQVDFSKSAEVDAPAPAAPADGAVSAHAKRTMQTRHIAPAATGSASDDAP
jgi:hypothetical protein